MRKLFLLLLIYLLLPATSVASTHHQVKVTSKKHIHKKKPPKVEPVTAHLTPAPNPFKITGYIDGSYSNLQRNFFISDEYDRSFDNAQNGFTLHQVAMTLAYQPAHGFGGLINPVMGYDTNLFYTYGVKPISEFDSQTFSFDLPQLFLQYTFNKLTLSFGRYLELAGYETLDPTQDNNFSRSILFGFAEPLTVSGFRGTYQASDKLTIIGGIQDGWDTIRDWNKGPTFEINATYSPNAKFTIAPSIYTGQERVIQPTDYGPKGWRTLFDLIVTMNLTDKFSVTGNYDYAWQTLATLPSGNNGRAAWQGIAGYLNYKFNDAWRGSVRGEYFNDQDGYRTGVRQAWKEVTVSLAFITLKHLEIRAETRRDFSNVASFTNMNLVDTSKSLQSYGVEGFYSFS